MKRKKVLTVVIGIILAIIISFLFILKNSTKVLAEELIKVTFSVDGVVETVEIEKNTLVEEPEIPIKDNKEFSHWAEAYTLKKFDFKEPVTRDIKLVAQWKSKKEVDMQKDVANMVQNNKQEYDIFGIENKEEPNFLERVKDTKFIIIASITGVIGVILAIASIILSKKTNEEKPKKKKIQKSLICRRCGVKLEEGQEECPICKTFVVRK